MLKVMVKVIRKMNQEILILKKVQDKKIQDLGMKIWEVTWVDLIKSSMKGKIVKSLKTLQNFQVKLKWKEI